MPCRGGTLRAAATAPGDRTAAPPPSRAESEKAARNGRSEAPRVTLRREVSRAAAAAGSEGEFFALLRASGVLVRTRDSARNPGEVTGYAVALAGDTARSGEPVWFGGGRLAPDLTLPKLRRRWPGAAPPAGGQLTAEERAAAWDRALGAVDAATAHIRQMAAGDPEAAADAAWAASGTMHAAAALLGSRVLRQAADAYDRAARAPYARVPAPTQAGDSLRAAARLLSVLAFVSGDPSLRPIVLITRLALLAEEVARMRQSQARAAQAASALSAARRLQDAAGGTRAGRGSRVSSGRRHCRGPGGRWLPGETRSRSGDPGGCLAAKARPATTAASPAAPLTSCEESGTKGKRKDLMDPSEMHPDLFGEAFSHSGQKLAQLGSLLASWATVQARRTERRAAAAAAQSEQQLRELREQETAAWRLARAGWAPDPGPPVAGHGRPARRGPRVERRSRLGRRRPGRRHRAGQVRGPAAPPAPVRHGTV